jgi:hypothetical protein
MDQQNYAADMVATPWDEGPAERIELFAAGLASTARNLGRMVTHPGGESDMNAPLVNSVRQAALLEVHLDLGYLANDVRKMLAQQKSEAERSAQRAAMTSYGQGVADGVEKGKDYHAREVADAEARSLHGNPNLIREQERVIIPAGYVAAWFHVLEEPDGTKYQRQVFGRLAADVREGDTRAVIVAGPDRLLVGLDRIRFAPTLATIVAEADLALLDGLEVRHEQSTVRLRDGMDANGTLDVTVHTLKPGEESEGSQPGTYIRFTTQDGERTVFDLSKGQWQHLVQAVEALYARRVIADAQGDES